MKNKDRYKEQIIGIVMDGDAFAITKDGMPDSCWDTRCTDCIFGTKGPCKLERKKWLNQEAEILDETEKTYLRNLIKPFRERVIEIHKNNDTSDTQYISIAYNEIKGLTPIDDTRYIVLPSFVKGTMYKGMKVGRKYTVEDLGL